MAENSNFTFDVRGISDKEEKLNLPEIGAENVAGNNNFEFQARPQVTIPSTDSRKTIEPTINPATGTIFGAGSGFVAGTAEKQFPKYFPKVTDAYGSAGERWARPVVGMPYSDTASSVSEQAQAYQRAKGQSPVMQKFYKMFPPAAPGEPSSTVERMLARSRAAEEAAKGANLQRISQGLGRIPFGSTAMGGLGGAQIAQAVNAAKQGDIPQAAISGAGGAGALASLIPRVAPRIIGGGAGLLSLPAQFVYDAIKGSMDERQKNIPAKTSYLQRTRGLPVEEEIREAQEAGPAMFYGLGGLPRTQQ